MEKDKCPYEIEWFKLSNKEKIDKPAPCTTCTLDRAICKDRLIWAYNHKKSKF